MGNILILNLIRDK